MNGKPCDNTAFLKELDCIGKKMKDAEKGFPYGGVKEHFMVGLAVVMLEIRNIVCLAIFYKLKEI